jgi:Protein of unknown function, DUF547
MTRSVRLGKWLPPCRAWVPILLSLGATFPERGTASQSPHHKLDAVLRAHVADGVADYPGIAPDVRFTEYLQALERVDPERLPTREERLAYWINAYNAFAIKGILDRSSPNTLLGRLRYFKLKDYRAGGRDINLYDLERKILIPMAEPRIHFAIVCASESCPRLRSEAYSADRIEQQLDDPPASSSTIQAATFSTGHERWPIFLRSSTGLKTISSATRARSSPTWVPISRTRSSPEN